MPAIAIRDIIVHDMNNANTSLEVQAQPARVVLVGTYKGDQLTKWSGWYNYPLLNKDTIGAEDAAKVSELWLFHGTKEQMIFKAEFVGIKTREELVRDYGYPAKGRAHGDKYLLFKTEYQYDHEPLLQEEHLCVIVRAKDFATSPKVHKQLKAYLESPDRNNPALNQLLPGVLTQISPEHLCVCEDAMQLTFWDLPQMRQALTLKNDLRIIQQERNVCAPIAEYSRVAASKLRNKASCENDTPIRVVELFAGVGGFRIGLERASNRFETVWNNQWEPATKRQDASLVYQDRFGMAGHSNVDIGTVPASLIPEADLLVGGFPCQDYSVATTLKKSGGIQGKKGVLWWQIHRILHDSKTPPPYLFLENVDRLLKSPASQRGRDFAIILASLSDLGYMVEWRVINAADYGMPQRRRRTYIIAYREGTPLAHEATASQKNVADWIFKDSIIGRAFSSGPKDDTTLSEFDIQGTLPEVTQTFNKGMAKTSPFKEAGLMISRHVWTQEASPIYDGMRLTLGQLVVDESDVPEEFFIDDNSLEEWKYLKGPKSEMRKTPQGFEYHYSEGGMAFPDPLDKPSRTIITGEGGASPSRFKHVILTQSGRYRRLIPLELERLNMFPDNHTKNASDGRRAFLMGNALVTGIVERIGLVLKERI